MWAGVLNEFATIKLSGSPRALGRNKTNVPNAESIMRNPTKSFTVKYQWKGILSEEEVNPNGLLLPVLCKSKTWKTTVEATSKGVRKWNE